MISSKEKKVEWYSSIFFLSIILTKINNKKIDINNRLWLRYLILENKIRNIPIINKDKSIKLFSGGSNNINNKIKNNIFIQKLL